MRNWLLAVVSLPLVAIWMVSTILSRTTEVACEWLDAQQDRAEI